MLAGGGETGATDDSRFISHVKGVPIVSPAVCGASGNVPDIALGDQGRRGLGKRLFDRTDSRVFH